MISPGIGHRIVVRPTFHMTARQQDLAVRPIDPPLTVPLYLAWRHPAPAAVHALAALTHGTAHTRVA